MSPKKLPRSLKKYIRQEKNRIRREVLDFQEQKMLINELYKRFLKQPQAEQSENKKQIKIATQAPQPVISNQ